MDIKLAAKHTVDSIVDGVGLRTVIWFQGCAHGCKNCHNPQTHSFENGFYESIPNIIDFVLSQKIQSGVTLSGGDPFYQADGLYELVKSIKQHDINIWCYTGFLYEYILEKYKHILEYIDVLVDGPYIDELKKNDLYFCGSSNQRVINVNESLKQNSIILVQYN